MIEELSRDRLPQAMELVWRVFQEFEAPEYAPEGVETFRQYIRAEDMAIRVQSGDLRLWGDWGDGDLRGVLALRARHISLLFVDKRWHRQGIARGLLETAASQCRETGREEITVHSSPYGVGIYERLGFVPVDKERVEDGIRYTPMVLRLCGET